jgi:uncharacterized Ntn-hydrolase superfamily protein
MGRAFKATDGELAERLFAALKAGDDAGGDARGKQSASMLVVRKGGGRNINNDRYIYINVDDSPAPIPELRRLLDINLGLLYQEKVDRLRQENKPKEARDAAFAIRRKGLIIPRSGVRVDPPPLFNSLWVICALPRSASLGRMPLRC